MAAVRIGHGCVAPRPCARNARAVMLLVLLQGAWQGGCAMADPVALDAPAAAQSGDMAAMAAGNVASGLSGNAPPMICEQLRGGGTERCRPVARLLQAQGSPEHHRTRGAHLPVAEMAPASAADH